MSGANKNNKINLKVDLSIPYRVLGENVFIVTKTGHILYRKQSKKDLLNLTEAKEGKINGVERSPLLLDKQSVFKVLVDKNKKPLRREDLDAYAGANEGERILGDLTKAWDIFGTDRVEKIIYKDGAYEIDSLQKNNSPTISPAKIFGEEEVLPSAPLETKNMDPGNFRQVKGENVQELSQRFIIDSKELQNFCKTYLQHLLPRIMKKDFVKDFKGDIQQSKKILGKENPFDIGNENGEEYLIIYPQRFRNLFNKVQKNKGDQIHKNFVKAWEYFINLDIKDKQDQTKINYGNKRLRDLFNKINILAKYLDDNEVSGIAINTTSMKYTVIAKPQFLRSIIPLTPLKINNVFYKFDSRGDLYWKSNKGWTRAIFKILVKGKIMKVYVTIKNAMIKRTRDRKEYETLIEAWQAILAEPRHNYRLGRRRVNS
ncbi:hypothetical protein OAR19_00220 [bacterium]|nr:hypothetical protein [bacterium]